MMSRTPQERSIEGMVRYVEDYGNRYGVYIQVEGDKNELIAIREGEIPQPGEKISEYLFRLLNVTSTVTPIYRTSLSLSSSIREQSFIRVVFVSAVVSPRSPAIFCATIICL